MVSALFSLTSLHSGAILLVLILLATRAYKQKFSRSFTVERGGIIVRWVVMSCRLGPLPSP